MADNTKTLKMWQEAAAETKECLPLETLERMVETPSGDAKAALGAEDPEAATLGARLVDEEVDHVVGLFGGVRLLLGHDVKSERRPAHVRSVSTRAQVTEIRSK